jgi:hypothetical protein
MNSPAKIIARDDLVDQIIENTLKGRSTWLVAPEGMGKTTLIHEAKDELEDKHNRQVIHCDESTRFKPLVLDIAHQLHSLGILVIEKFGEDICEIPWDKLQPKLSRPAVTEIAPAVIESMEGHDIILILDELEGITPTYLKHYRKFFETASVIAASSSFSNAQVQKLKGMATILNVPAFTQEQAEELSEFLFNAHSINTGNEPMLKRHLLSAANGNPQKVHQLYDQISKERYVTQDQIRAFSNQAGKRFLNMGLLLLCLVTLPLMAKVLARGAGDRDGFVAFGMMSAGILVLRILIFRHSRD